MQLRVTNVKYDILDYGYMAGHPMIFIDFEFTDTEDPEYNAWDDFTTKVNETEYLASIDGSLNVMYMFRECAVDTEEKAKLIWMFMSRIYYESKAYQELRFDPKSVEDPDNWMPIKPMVSLLTSPNYTGRNYYERFDAIYMDVKDGDKVNFLGLINASASGRCQLNYKVTDTFNEEDYKKYCDTLSTNKVLLVVKQKCVKAKEMKEYALKNHKVIQFIQ